MKPESPAQHEAPQLSLAEKIWKQVISDYMDDSISMFVGVRNIENLLSTSSQTPPTPQDEDLWCVPDANGYIHCLICREAVEKEKLAAQTPPSETAEAILWYGYAAV